jgi:hypothetical protein
LKVAAVDSACGCLSKQVDWGEVEVPNSGAASTHVEEGAGGIPGAEEEDQTLRAEEEVVAAAGDAPWWQTTIVV